MIARRAKFNMSQNGHCAVRTQWRFIKNNFISILVKLVCAIKISVATIDDNKNCSCRTSMWAAAAAAATPAVAATTAAPAADGNFLGAIQRVNQQHAVFFCCRTKNTKLSH